MEQDTKRNFYTLRSERLSLAAEETVFSISVHISNSDHINRQVYVLNVRDLYIKSHSLCWMIYRFDL